MQGHGFLFILVLVWTESRGTALHQTGSDPNDNANDQTMHRVRRDGASGRGDVKTADDMLSLFDQADTNVAALAQAASLQLETLKTLTSLKNLETHRLQVNSSFLETWKKKFSRHCPMNFENVKCDQTTFYRSADGTCNNLKNPTWGATFSPELREIPPMYDDGVDAPRARDRLGNPLPSARLVSNVVHKITGDGPRNPNRTMMVMQWGQFIDHEFVSTPVITGKDDTSLKCCEATNFNRSECLPIEIPADDSYFNKTCMNFVRSAPVPNLHCDPGFREQMNQATSFIDGSAVYGSKQEETLSLRALTKGLLKTASDASNMLPSSPDDVCSLNEPKDYCQHAGDFRVNVVPSLGMMHTAFLREHNKIAARLAELNPTWDDETLFQEARRLVGAIEQLIRTRNQVTRGSTTKTRTNSYLQTYVITYKEYIPAIMTNDSVYQYKLDLKTSGYYKGYRKRLNPTISNEFAAAAFRFGHSQIANYMGVMSERFTYVKKTPIERTYHNPHLLLQDGGSHASGIARWLVDDTLPLPDGLFEDGVRDKLFQDSALNSLDLVALNIQRGRDHGLPSYNHYRLHCGLEAATMNSDGSFRLPNHTDEQRAKLEQVYRHVDDIDLFSGAMTETLLPASCLGSTFTCLIGRQFRRLKVADRFWYETVNERLRFTKAQLQEIRKITLARLMCNNFDFDRIQPNVFSIPGPENERVSCDLLPDIDLSKWKASSRRRRDGRPFYLRF